ncbi:MAG: amidohydrolase family protein [Lentisphaeria bacterium]|nr:amidohydrolase family protein [Lentisphaeria bacterium]
MIRPFEKINGFDREIWQEELEDFVPKRIFDVHTHLWDDRFAPPEGTTTPQVHWRDLDSWSREVFPGRDIGFLLLGMPVSGMKLDGFHAFMAGEIARSEHRLGSTIVTPAIPAHELEELIEKYHFRGLKPYRFFAPDPADCRITDYFPEELIEVADGHGMFVTLHLAKFDGVADPENLADLVRLTRRYPRVRWILAHCARAFNPYTLEKTVFALRDLPNIWYDLSAVCDARSHYLLMKHEDISRLMFGTDNICAGGVRGNYITWGRGWKFFPGAEVSHCRGDATLVCYEQLRAMKRASDMAGLTSDDVEAVFYGNARAFFGF